MSDEKNPKEPPGENAANTRKQSHIRFDPELEARLSLSYTRLREILPDISENDLLCLKDEALDNAMKDFKDFIGQLERQKQLDPNFPITIGGLITTLKHILDIFKIQRSIIEELKEAVSGCF
jgi:hypothetical protein